MTSNLLTYFPPLVLYLHIFFIIKTYVFQQLYSYIFFVVFLSGVQEGAHTLPVFLQMCERICAGRRGGWPYLKGTNRASGLPGPLFQQSGVYYYNPFQYIDDLPEEVSHSFLYTYMFYIYEHFDHKFIRGKCGDKFHMFISFKKNVIPRIALGRYMHHRSKNVRPTSTPLNLIDPTTSMAIGI